MIQPGSGPEHVRLVHVRQLSHGLGTCLFRSLKLDFEVGPCFGLFGSHWSSAAERVSALTARVSLCILFLAVYHHSKPLRVHRKLGRIALEFLKLAPPLADQCRDTFHGAVTHELTVDGDGLQSTIHLRHLDFELISGFHIVYYLQLTIGETDLQARRRIMTFATCSPTESCASTLLIPVLVSR